MTISDDAGAGQPARVHRLSYFFPAHNEEANLEGLVDEALTTLPSLAEVFEIIAVNDGSTDRTREIADRLAAANPDVVRVVHHDVNRGYGGALRSGFEASRFELLAFTDGDRQFRVADLGRLTARLAEADHPDVVVGYRISSSASPTHAPTSWQTASSSASGSGTWTAPASCSAARPSTASASSRGAPSSRRSC